MNNRWGLLKGRDEQTDVTSGHASLEGFWKVTFIQFNLYNSLKYMIEDTSKHAHMQL